LTAKHGIPGDGSSLRYMQFLPHEIFFISIGLLALLGAVRDTGSVARIEKFSCAFSSSSTEGGVYPFFLSCWSGQRFRVTWESGVCSALPHALRFSDSRSRNRPFI